MGYNKRAEKSLAGSAFLDPSFAQQNVLILARALDRICDLVSGFYNFSDESMETRLYVNNKT